MPISASQWRTVTGLNNASRRPRQVGIKPIYMQQSCGSNEKHSPPEDINGNKTRSTGKSKRLRVKKGSVEKVHCTAEEVNINNDSKSTQQVYADSKAILYLTVALRCLVAIGSSLSLLQSFRVVIMLLLLLLAGDVETNPGPTSHLTLDNLDEVCSALSDVCESDKWKQIGTLLLNVPTDTFDQQPVGSLKDILQTWLISKTESTWEKLADTLNVVGEAELARKLKNMYCEDQSDVGESEEYLDVDNSCILNVDDSFDVLSAVYGIAANYFSLGHALRLRDGDLEVIKQDTPMNSCDALRMVVSHWLKQNYNTERFGKPTWRMLVGAVAHPNGGSDCALARRIAKDHPIVSQINDCSEMDVSSIKRNPSTLHQTGKKRPSSSVSPAPSQKRIPVTNRLPATLESVGLHSSEQAEHFQCRFTELLEKTLEYLQKKGVQTRDFVTKFSTGLPLSSRDLSWNFVEHYIPTVDLNSTPFETVWIQLNKTFCWDFINCDVLEHVLHMFVDDVYLNAEMEAYKADVRKLRENTKVSNFYKHWPVPTRKPDETNMKEVVAKVDKTWEECTLQDVKNVSSAIVQKFLLPRYVFTAEDVKQGCVSIVWYVPASVASLLANGLRNTEREFFQTNYLQSIRIDGVYVYSQTQSDYSSYLQSIYRHVRSAVSTDDPIPFKLAKVEEHQIVHGFQADEFTKKTIRGDKDDIWFKKSPIESLSNLGILDDGTLASLILIEGAPGSGKTTISRMFCQQWAEVKVLNEDSPIVLVLLHLRDHGVKDITSLEELFEYTKSDINPQLVKEVESCAGKGFAFWLDGWDEFEGSLDTEAPPLFYKLISGEILPKATVFISSRPWATKYVKQQLNKRPSQNVEIVASVQDQMDYLQKKSPKSINLAKFLDYVEKTPAIKAAMHTPLATNITMEVFNWSIEENYVLPSTVTELYTAYTWKTIAPFFPDLKMEVASWKGEIFDSIPITSSYKKTFDILCKLAYDGLVLHQQQLVFLELPKELLDLITLQLMQTRKPLYASKKHFAPSYHFNHHTLQEYLAACWISQQTSIPEELSHDLEKLFAHGSFNMVLRFLSGLSKLNYIPRDMIVRLLDSKEDRLSNDKLTVFHWLFEGGKLAPAVLGEGNFFVGSDYTWTPLDYFVTGFSIAHSNCAWAVHFSRSSMNDEKMELFTNGLCTDSDSNEKGCITSIDLDENELSSHCFERIANVPVHVLINLKQIDLSQNSFDKIGTEFIANALPKMPNLTSLSLSNCNIGRGGAVRLLSVLKSCKQLKQLQLSVTNIGEEDCIQLGDLLSCSKNIESLDICDNSLSSDSLKYVLKGLQQNSSLKHLDIGSLHNGRACHFSNDVAVDLSCYLQDVDRCKLEKLCMGNCNIELHTVTILAKSLCKNTSLSQLCLKKNPIGDKGAVELSKALEDNLTLNVLDLDMCMISSTGGIALATMLRRNAALNELILSHNNIGDESAEQFSLALRHNGTCHTLWLHGDHTISKVGISSLCESIQHNHSMKKLWLPGQFHYEADERVGWYWEM